MNDEQREARRKCRRYLVRACPISSGLWKENWAVNASLHMGEGNAQSQEPVCDGILSATVAILRLLVRSWVALTLSDPPPLDVGEYPACSRV